MPNQVLPDPQTAFNNLFLGVSRNVFFEKLAADGIAPRNDHEAAWMLETAGKLRAIDEHPHVKAAQADANPLVQASRELDSLLAQLHGPTKLASEQDTSIRQLAARLAGEPAYYNSVLTLKAAEAAELQAHLAQRRA